MTNNIRNIWAIGRNYGAHAKELGNSLPEKPLVFLKAGSSALESGQTLALPPWSSQIHHEVELALEFGPDLSNPFPIVRGLVAVDLTARDIQDEAKKKGLPWTQAKSFKGACLLGSRFDVKTTPENLSLILTVNGERRQHGHIRDMIFPIPVLVKHVLEYFPVCPGDLLLTGTPSGVGPLEDGDELVVEIPEVRSQGRWNIKRSPAPHAALQRTPPNTRT
ncbi:MAG TPA: fumarylacetoacetate hydrolase family protein [Bdellovibrionales bacterium]|nr:fumarylacetoacetate hydrolase family protein [Bdellovibrionales bacterium]